MRIRLLLVALAVAATASLGVRAEQQGQGGMVSSEVAALDNQVVGEVDASGVFPNANFQSGGTGMRNQRRGAIMINGVVPGGVTPITHASVYWAISTANTNPLTTLQRKITFARQWPTTSTKPAAVSIIGSEIATTADPCWGGSRLHVLKANVSSVVTGNGLYRVQIYAGGSFAGGDPWNSPVVYPIQEGASLVVVYPQNGVTTAIYDGQGISNMTSGTLTYTLTLPFATSAVKIDLAGADGQYGSSRSPSIAGETTTINGVHVGATSAWNDSLWNGKSGLPLPQLWDNDGRRVGLPASTSALTVTHNAFGDCVVPIVNTVSNAGL